MSSSLPSLLLTIEPPPTSKEPLSRLFSSMEASASTSSSSRKRSPPPSPNAEASGSRPPPSSSSSSSTSSRAALGPPPRAPRVPQETINVFEEPFVIDEEPEDPHGEGLVPERQQGEVEVDVELEEEEGEGADRTSMYVSLFEDMLKTVLEQESYLFTEAELATFERYKALSYNARYLLIRLLLRTPRIHRQTPLAESYAGEIGKQNIGATMDELCLRFDGSKQPTVAPAGKGKEKEKIVIDLTEDEEHDDPELARALRESLKSFNNSSSSSVGVNGKGKENGVGTGAKGKGKEVAGAGGGAKKLPQAVVDALDMDERPLDLSHFCAAASSGEVGEERLLRYLKLNELKEVAKAMKVWKTGLTYPELISKILATATSQSVISFPVLPSPSNSYKPKPKPTTSNSATKQSTLSFGQRPKMSDGRTRLATVVRNVMGKTVMVNEDIRKLWKRLNLIFYRSTIAPPSLLLPQILSKSHHRTYPTYTPTRTLSLFPTRLSLLSYERALLLELEVDDALGEQETLNGTRPFSKAMMARDLATGKVGGASFGGGAAWGSGFGNTGGRKEGAEVVKAIYEGVWEKWKEEVRLGKEMGMEGRGARAVGDRFQPGHILTRIISKGSYALGVLHDFNRECEVLKALLAQKIWRRGKRGAWYERLALILMTKHKGQDDEIEKKEEALDICMDGLEDEDTHLIYRPSLTRRLTRLEKQLKLLPEECHRCEGELKTCETVTLVAKRIRHKPSSEEEDGDEVEEGSSSRRKSRGRSTAEPGGGEEEGGGEVAKKTTWGAKSSWVGRDDTEVGVEQWVLEQWEDRGWKGFHAEGSILTTIFGLLFWDVLFAPVPGAFETAFQSAPLDLGEDSFAIARGPLVASQLAKIEAGQAPDILRAVDERERDNETMCVGVRWDFGREDLLEIVESIGGHGLSIICRMLSEEYGQRNSGVPDLVVWNYAERAVRWIEVKGPGDTLSSTQKVWIDVLLSADIDVEVCKVAEEGAPVPKKKRARSGSAASGGGRGRSRSARGGGGDQSDLEEMPEEEEEAEEDEEEEVRPKLKKRKSSGSTSTSASGSSGSLRAVKKKSDGGKKKKRVVDSDEEEDSDCCIVLD